MKIFKIIFLMNFCLKSFKRTQDTFSSKQKNKKQIRKFRNQNKIIIQFTIIYKNPTIYIP